MTTDKSDIEALACDIYNAHRTERIIAGAKNVASWWGMDARNREHWMKVARRLQPARVTEEKRALLMDAIKEALTRWPDSFPAIHFMSAAIGPFEPITDDDIAWAAAALEDGRHA